MRERVAITRALRGFLCSRGGSSYWQEKQSTWKEVFPSIFLSRRIWPCHAYNTTGSRTLNSEVPKLGIYDRTEEKRTEKDKSSLQIPKVVFVLGGPGSGKGTQCAMIVEHFGFTHLSAGDLLRDEIKSGSENGITIQNTIKEGRIVPSIVTVRLLQNAMRKSDKTKLLIDGFPRNDENRITFEDETGIKPEFVLFFDCTEEEMEKRLLARNQGRVDDNVATIRKRFTVFVESSLPVIKHYESCGKLYKINAVGTKGEIFESVKSLFLPFVEKDG